jgi:hypothetical protein
LALIILFLKMSKFSKNYFFQGKENRRWVNQLSFRESQALVNIARGQIQGCGQRCYNYYWNVMLFSCLRAFSIYTKAWGAMEMQPNCPVPRFVCVENSPPKTTQSIPCNSHHSQ